MDTRKRRSLYKVGQFYKMFMLYGTNRFEFEVAERPVVGGNSFRVNDEPFNPTLRLRSGETYQFYLNLPPPHGLQFYHQDSSGLILLEEIVNNGIGIGTITWAITQDSPREVVYQSSADPEMIGLILIDSDSILESNGVQLARLDGWADSLPQLVEKFNHNARLFLTHNEDWAGRGLRLKDRTLELDSPDSTIYLQDESGQVARVDRTLQIQDTGTLYQDRMTLNQALNFIAQEFRRIKNPNRPWHESTNFSVENISQQVEELKSLTHTLIDLYTQQVRDYTELIENYKVLKSRFENHKHKASDLTEGVLAPTRLGIGTPTNQNFLRGDGRWVNR
ncbi:hypothetical protein ACQ4M3_09430 [Leptolyngbya sp. AN03gr2]|uniref:hypothetical protein n=1 Tax=Leptolyngbya sp. AN03gr2 TaxID=3423364 RepID=UPI003D30F494